MSAPVCAMAFYHLSRSPEIAAVAALAGKALAAGHKLKITTATPEQAVEVDRMMWSHDPASFLPHVLADDEMAARTPVVISADDAAPNGATMLMLLGGARHRPADPWQRCFYLFDGNADEPLQAARAFWRELKDSGQSLDYWRENEDGWELSATYPAAEEKPLS